MCRKKKTITKGEKTMNTYNKCIDCKEIEYIQKDNIMYILRCRKDLQGKNASMTCDKWEQKGDKQMGFMKKMFPDYYPRITKSPWASEMQRGGEEVTSKKEEIKKKDDCKLCAYKTAIQLLQKK